MCVILPENFSESLITNVHCQSLGEGFAISSLFVTAE